MKIYFSNTGCSAENVEFKRLVSLIGAEESLNPFDADVIIASFCGISTDAFEAIPDHMAVLKHVKEYISDIRIYVGGCAEGIVDLKARYNFIDGTFRRRHMVEDLAPYFDCDIEKNKDTPISFYNCVAIQSGCMRHCGFCKKAYMDMPLSSKPIDLVVRDVKDAISKGHPDILLLAENSTEYGLDFSDTVRLIDLLKVVIQIKGVKSVSITALCVDELSLPQNEELLNFIRDCDLINEVQIEIQSLIPEVRKNMRLSSSVEDVLRVLKELKGKHIVTNIMLGYPGETNRGFEQQLKLIEENELYYVQANMYDDTPLVYGHSFEQIPRTVTLQRVITLVNLIKRIRKKKVKELVESSKLEPVSCMYITENKWRVMGASTFINLDNGNFAIGDIVQARIEGVDKLVDIHDKDQALYLRGKII